MAGTTAYPGALDTTTTLPTAATLGGIELDGDGTDDHLHENVHGVAHEAVVALETKVGTGAGAPVANAVLAGSAAGVAGWDKTPGLDGVAFPATQVPSADANTLDDYEEGTFTPGIADDTADGSGEGQAYSTQVGRYTKIGNRVFFNLRVVITNLGTLTVGNGAKVVGLPFTANAAASGNHSISVGYANSLALPNASETVTGFVQPSTAWIALYNWDSTAGTTILSIAELSAGAGLRISGQYEV